MEENDNTPKQAEEALTDTVKKEEYERKTYGIVPMDYIGRDDYILEDYALWSNIEDTFNYGPDSGNNVYWTVNTRDLIEQIVKSNDIFKNQVPTKKYKYSFESQQNECKSLSGLAFFVYGLCLFENIRL